MMSVSDLTKSIIEAAGSLPQDTKPEERAALLDACNQLKSSLESPFDVVTRLITGTHVHSMAITGIRMGVFDTVKADPMKVEKIASTLNADPGLVVRVMRTMARVGFFQEVGQDEYVATPMAGVMVTGSPLQDAVLHFGLIGEVLCKAPYYFVSNGFQNPSDTYDGPFQHAFQTKLQYFEWLKNEPEHNRTFNSMMQVQRQAHGEDWTAFYPVEERLKTKSDAPLLVDIGGGLGHDLAAFHNQFPNLPGRLILQDMPQVLNQIAENSIPSEIERMEYDFFKTQPVKGARAYYLRTILHDWPNKQALQILAPIHEAMDKDSILLLNENAIPDTNVSMWSCGLDLTMMALFASLDRTEKQFVDLLDEAGFRLVKVWKSKPVPGAPVSFLFEAVKK